MSGDMVIHDNFAFHGHRWPLLVDSRGRFASFSRACQLLGVPVAREWARVQRYPEIASLARIEFGPKGEELYFIQAEAVPTWLLVIPPGEVPDHTRRLRAEITRELVPAIYDFVTTGLAISAALTPMEVVDRVTDKLLRIDNSEHNQIIVASYLKNRMIAEACGSAAGGKPEFPVMVGLRVQELGYRLGESDMQHVGRLVAAEYRRRNGGRSPGTTPQDIKGGMRPVKSYRESDREWIDRIIIDYVRRKPLR